MMGGVKWVCSCAASLSVSLVVAGAFAEEVPFRVDYRAQPTCPSVDAFSAELVERSRQLRIAGPTEAASLFEVELREREGGFAGMLLLHEPNGRVTEREVASASCDEVVSALALIAAVLIDPASGQSTGAGARTASNETRRAAPPERRAPVRRTKPAPEPRAPEAETQNASVPPRRRVLFGAGIGTVLEDAVAPGVAAGLFGELDASVGTDGVVHPLVALQVARTLTTRAETEAGIAELTFTAARLLACPLRWPPSDALSLRPCASAEVGFLRASGTATSLRASSDALWFAPGLGARIEARPAAGLRLTLDAGVVFPVTRDRFYFDPDTPQNTAFEVPAIGGTGRLGLIVALN
jgi:hypothetical protein